MDRTLRRLVNASLDRLADWLVGNWVRRIDVQLTEEDIHRAFRLPAAPSSGEPTDRPDDPDVTLAA